MALNFISIIKTLSQSKAVASTVSTLINEYKGIKKSNINLDEIKKSLEVQSALNEQLEKQIKILQVSIEKINKNIYTLVFIAIFSGILSLTAIILYIISTS